MTVGVVNTLPTLSKRCDFAAIQAFAVLSDDYNPIHIDPAFAATTAMGSIIAHGPMALGLVWQMIEQAFGAQTNPHVELDVRFRQPVRENDVISTGGTLRDPGGGYDIWVRNQRGEDVIMGTMMLRP